MASGPKRAPGRPRVPWSKGIPIKATSAFRSSRLAHRGALKKLRGLGPEYRPVFAGSTGGADILIRVGHCYFPILVPNPDSDGGGRGRRTYRLQKGRPSSERSFSCTRFKRAGMHPVNRFPLRRRVVIPPGPERWPNSGGYFAGQVVPAEVQTPKYGVEVAQLRGYLAGQVVPAETQDPH